MRRGAASCRAVPRSCPVTAAAGVVTAEPSWIDQRRRHCNPSEVRAAQPAVAVVAVQDVRTPATAVVAGPRPLSAIRTDVRPTGRADVWCPGDGCPRDRGDPGCPDGHASGVHSRCSRAVRTVLDPGIRRCGGTGHIGAPGWTCRCGRCAAWSSLPESGLAGRNGRTLAVRGSHEGRPPTWTATWYAYRLRRRARCSATMGAGPAPVPVGWRGVGEGAGVPSPPQVRPGKVAGVVPDHGAGHGGVTTLGGRWAGDAPVSSVPEDPSASAGERLRPQRGRGTCELLSARRWQRADQREQWWARQGLNL